MPPTKTGDDEKGTTPLRSIRDDAEAVEEEGEMENGTSLDDILNDEPTEEAAQPETIGQPRDEHGRFSSQEQGEEQQEAEEPTAEAGPPPAEQEQSHIPIAALKDERSKRQQLEEQYRQAAERLQQYEAYFQQVQQGQQPEEELDPVEVIAQQVMSRLQPQHEMQILTTKVDFAEQLARQKWADYDDKVEHFKEAAKSNPFLIEELRNAANPAEYAYTVAGKILEAKQYGQAPSREEMEAQMRAQIMAELGINRPQVPTTLATERSVGSRSGPAWSGPTPLDDLLG